MIDENGEKKYEWGEEEDIGNEGEVFGAGVEPRHVMLDDEEVAFS